MENTTEPKKKFVKITRPPWQLIKFENSSNPYLLQKCFVYRGLHYDKICFKDSELNQLAEILFKIKSFRTAWKEAVKSNKKKANEVKEVANDKTTVQ